MNAAALPLPSFAEWLWAGIISLMASIFTDVGETKAADFWDGTASAPANWYVAWGTGTTTAAKGQTALVTPSAESRVAATKTQPSADVNRHVATITSASGQTITEVGVFDASTSGNMVIRADFSGIALLTGDSIEFTIDLTWS